MDNRVYLWLFGNIAKYDFVGAEALEIKNSFSRMLITEESLASDAISNQMRVLYEKFISLFYNNIYGYKNGFACKAITSAHLDCYFIKTPDGFVPIGYVITVPEFHSCVHSTTATAYSEKWSVLKYTKPSLYVARIYVTAPLSDT